MYARSWNKFWKLEQNKQPMQVVWNDVDPVYCQCTNMYEYTRYYVQLFT